MSAKAPKEDWDEGCPRSDCREVHPETDEDRSCPMCNPLGGVVVACIHGHCWGCGSTTTPPEETS